MSNFSSKKHKRIVFTTSRNSLVFCHTLSLSQGLLILNGALLTSTGLKMVDLPNVVKEDTESRNMCCKHIHLKSQVSVSEASFWLSYCFINASMKEQQTKLCFTEGSLKQ